MQQFLDKADVTRIKAEHQRYLDAGEVVTMPLHQRILETWKRDSPKMYLRLRTQGVLEAMAFNCQQRMWAECDLLEIQQALDEAHQIPR